MLLWQALGQRVQVAWGSCFSGSLVKVPVCSHDDTPVWREPCIAETNLQCFRLSNKRQIQMKFSGCCQRFEKALSSWASMFWISHRVSRGSTVMTSCKQGPQLYALKWDRCRSRQDGGDPVTLFLHVPGLIDIHNKKKREKLRLPWAQTSLSHAMQRQAE